MNEKECGGCAYKYSCGYSSLRAGNKTGSCCEPHLFRKVKIRYWSPLNQKLELESEVISEEYGVLKAENKTEVEQR